MTAIKQFISNHLHTQDAVSAVSYVASGGTAVYGWISFEKFIAGAGLLLAIATFGVNWIYRHKTYKLMKKTDDDKKSKF